MSASVFSVDKWPFMQKWFKEMEFTDSQCRDQFFVSPRRHENDVSISFHKHCFEQIAGFINSPKLTMNLLPSDRCLIIKQNLVKIKKYNPVFVFHIFILKVIVFKDRKSTRLNSSHQ